MKSLIKRAASKAYDVMYYEGPLISAFLVILLGLAGLFAHYHMLLLMLEFAFVTIGSTAAFVGLVYGLNKLLLKGLAALADMR